MLFKEISSLSGAISADKKFGKLAGQQVIDRFIDGQVDWLIDLKMGGLIFILLQRLNDGQIYKLKGQMFRLKDG